MSQDSGTRYVDPAPRERLAVVVVEPAGPAPADAPRLHPDPAGLEVEHGDPVPGRRLRVPAIDARPLKRARGGPRSSGWRTDGRGRTAGRRPGGRGRLGIGLERAEQGGTAPRAREPAHPALLVAEADPHEPRLSHVGARNPRSSLSTDPGSVKADLRTHWANPASAGEVTGRLWSGRFGRWRPATVTRRPAAGPRSGAGPAPGRARRGPDPRRSPRRPGPGGAARPARRRRGRGRGRSPPGAPRSRSGS